MACGNRRGHPLANAEHHQNADPNDDHIMDAWEEQIKASNQMGGSPSAILPKLKSSAGYGQAGNWPKADTFQIAAMNPLQFWMQFAEQWQKASADAMAFWAKASKSDTVGLRRR